MAVRKSALASLCAQSWLGPRDVGQETRGHKTAVAVSAGGRRAILAEAGWCCESPELCACEQP